MIEEYFAEGDSVIHRTQPGLRVLMATIYSFCVAVLDDLPLLGIAVCFSIVLTVFSRLPLRPLVKRLSAAGGFLLLIWVMLPWTYPGNTLLSWGPIGITRQGVQLCLIITFKTFAILLAFTTLVATLPLATLGHSLNRLGMPSKMVLVLLLAYRYIFVIEQEYQRLFRAAKMRNFRPASNLHTYKTYAYLLGMVFVRASERARRVHLAMKCRGFNGRFHCLQEYSPTAWNAVLVASVGLVSLALIVFQILGKTAG